MRELLWVLFIMIVFAVALALVGDYDHPRCVKIFNTKEDLLKAHPDHEGVLKFLTEAV